MRFIDWGNNSQQVGYASSLRFTMRPGLRAVWRLQCDLAWANHGGLQVGDEGCKEVQACFSNRVYRVSSPSEQWFLFILVVSVLNVVGFQQTLFLDKALIKQTELSLILAYIASYYNQVLKQATKISSIQFLLIDRQYLKWRGYKTNYMRRRGASAECPKKKNSLFRWGTGSERSLQNIQVTFKFVHNPF